MIVHEDEVCRCREFKPLRSYLGLWPCLMCGLFRASKEGARPTVIRPAPRLDLTNQPWMS